MSLQRARRVAFALWALVAAVPLALAPTFAVAAAPTAELQHFYRAVTSGCTSHLFTCSDAFDATIVGDFAIADWGLPSGDQMIVLGQILYRKSGTQWHKLSWSRGDGFGTNELIERHVPRTIAARLVARNASALRAALPMRPERDCIHTDVKLATTYFEGAPGSGWVVVFFGRIHDPYQGTLEARVVNRGVPDLSAVRYGDHVQLCLVHFPGPNDCRPTFDPRGRYYRVFDYRLRQAFTSWNANHGCGGA